MTRSGSNRRSRYGEKAPIQYSDLYAKWAQACLVNPAEAARLARAHSDRFLGYPHERLTPSIAREMHAATMAAAGRARLVPTITPTPLTFWEGRP